VDRFNLPFAASLMLLTAISWGIESDVRPMVLHADNQASPV
jgi:hypothetical protein